MTINWSGRVRRARLRTLPAPRQARNAFAQNSARALCLAALLCALCAPGPLRAAPAAPVCAGIAVPAELFARLDCPAQGPVPPGKVLEALRGTPYRQDGALDETGRYTLFAAPERTLNTPGLNCSGFVLAASRFLLGRAIPLAEAGADREGDSGPGAPGGQDWDFGWDLILNISEGRERLLLLPDGSSADPAGYDGTFTGFDLHAAETWPRLLPRLRPGNVYLLSFNRTMARGRLMHYHTGLIWPEGPDRIWLYQTTSTGGRVNRRNLARADGLRSFLQAFANTGQIRKKLVVLEVPLAKVD